MEAIKKTINGYTIEKKQFTDQELSEMDERTRNAILGFRRLFDEFNPHPIPGTQAGGKKRGSDEKIFVDR